MDFWHRLESLSETSRLVIERPAGSPHPGHPEVRYPLDYGFLDGAAGGDGKPLDVWRGSLPTPVVTGVVCTADSSKRDGEYKILAGCSDADIRLVERFHTSEHTSCLVVRRPSDGPF
jgi:inorganic pyrophosphatase